MNNLHLKLNRPLFLRNRSRLAFLSIILLFSIPAIYYLHTLSTIPSHHRYNLSLSKTPKWLHTPLAHILPNPAGLLSSPTILKEIRDAPLASSWEIGKLSKPTYRLRAVTQGRLEREVASPALVMLHIFSTPSPSSRERRELIRRYTPLNSVPEKYRHLIEIKFVLGTSIPNKEEAQLDKQEEEEGEIEREIEKYGDIIRLEDLQDGENMNRGKTWEWLRYVGRDDPAARKAWWVLKCDDDTLPIIPNLLPLLVQNDPSIPTYLGTSIGRWPGYHYYFQGMMYGFSWGVVKTMAAANVSREIRNANWDEDARMGELMFSLPISPSSATRSQCRLSSQSKSESKEPNLRWSLPSQSPDPCAGLVRLDLGTRLGEWHGSAGWIADAGRAVGWHGLKDEQDYIAAYNEAVETFVANGKKYMWDVPSKLRFVAESG